MSTDFFRKYLDLLNEAETTGRLVANQPVIPGQPLSPVQMATVDFARSMGNQMGPEVDRAYDLAKQAGITPGPDSKSNTATNKSITASGQTPTDFTPTHFHKNNLGFKVPLMKTPDNKFWHLASDPENPRAGKTIQPWTGDTEDRSWHSISSVDGIYNVHNNGEPIEFPQGSTWKDFSEPYPGADNEISSTRSAQTSDPTKKVKEIPHIDPGPLIEPNKNVAPADPPGYRFSNDDALAALAAKLKDAETDGKSSGFDRVNKSGPGDGQTIPMIKSIMERIKAINPDPTVDTFESGPNTDKIMAILRELKQLPPKDTRTAEEQQQVESLLDELKAVMEDKFKNIPRTKGGAAPSGSASGAAASDAASSDGIGKFFNRSDKFQPSSAADSIASWEANNAKKSAATADGKLPDLVWDPVSHTLKPRAEVAKAAGYKLDRSAQGVDGKETIISGDSHCAQCGTPKSLHAPLKHEFVSGDDVRPGSVGGSAPSPDRSTKPASDTIDADQAKINKMPSWDRTKNAPVGATPPATLPAKPSRPKALKEDINQLPVVDQMRAWRQLMEADKPRIAVLPGETAAQAVERAQAELNAPKPTPAAQNTIPNKPKRPALLRPGVTTNRVPTNPPAADSSRFDSPEEIKARAERARNTSRAPAAVPVEVPVDTTAPARPRIRSVTGDVPVDPNFGRPPPPPPNIPPPANVPPESALNKLGKKAARGFDMFYQIYQGYQQIVKLDYKTMPRDQYWAAVNKIVARLAGDYGLFWVGSFLGGLIGEVFTGGNPLGLVAGFLAGGTGGLAASYLLGDSVGTITDSIVDHVYGTDKTPAPQQNKPTPEYIAKNKAYLENMTAWIAAGGIPDEQDKKDMAEVRDILKDAGVTVAPAPAPTKEGPKEGDTSTSKKNGRPMIFTNGRWEYAN